MVRQTSIEAYNQIKASNLLSERRWQVYDALFTHGPATANELKQHMAVYEAMGNQNIITRLGELRDMGCAVELEVRECNITGRNVIVWEVTDQLPSKLEKKSENIPRKHLEKCRNVLRKVYNKYELTRAFIQEEFRKLG